MAKLEGIICKAFGNYVVLRGYAPIKDIAAISHKPEAYQRDANPELKGNIRDYATINQLICLSNMESLNAIFINEGLPQAERLRRLNAIAIQQMSVLEGNETNRKLLK